MKIKYLLPLFGLVAFFANSQHEGKCIEHIKTAELWEQYPELEMNYYKHKQAVLNQLNAFQEKGGADDQVYIIPIVFHVLHEYGSENISDEQIYSAVRILNEDYRMLNADTSDIVPAFKKIVDDAKIEFRIATIDPHGNPTNGITRHFTNETNIGDGFSKFEQWPRGRYLNVWSTKVVGSVGAAGYAYKPIGVEGEARYLDGIMLNHKYIGDIGTANPFRSRALTHEIGHYLGLSHTWGDTNDPGVACGDDGIADTPRTKGWSVCDLAGKSGCNPDSIVENVQNFMEYAYCSNMYTKGQIAYMRNILKLDVSQRNNLWTEENLALSVPEGQVFDPVADFFVENKNNLITCVGNPVKFKNWTWRLSDGGSASYSWTFEDGDVATSSDKNPTVSFTTSGWKDVTLTVVQDGKTNTVTKENFIWVSPDWAPFSGNVKFDFDDNPNYWISLNPQKNVYQWKVREDAGVNGSGGIFLDVTNPYIAPVLYTDEYFFNPRRGGVKSAFVSQAIDLSYMSDIIVTFDHASATNGTTIDEITEELIVYSSVDCGKTWQLRKKISGIDLINNGSGWGKFYPSNTTIWSTDTLSLPSSSGNHVFLKFEYTGSDKSNNIAIDNINIHGTLGIDSYQQDSKLSVFPNPSNSEVGWYINYDAVQWGGANVQLIDIAGRIITTDKLPKNQSEWNVKPGANASQGVYFLKVNNNEKVIQQKLILK